MCEERNENNHNIMKLILIMKMILMIIEIRIWNRENMWHKRKMKMSIMIMWNNMSKVIIKWKS